MNERRLKHVTRDQYRQVTARYYSQWTDHATEANNFCVMQWLDCDGLVQAQATYHHDGRRIYEVNTSMAQLINR